MSEILQTLLNQLIPIFIAMLTGVISYLGMTLKNIIQKEAIEKEKKEIIQSTVHYVEQISKNGILTSAEKSEEAKEKAMAWLHEKKINISPVELDILVECAVKQLTDHSQLQ